VEKKEGKGKGGRGQNPFFKLLSKNSFSFREKKRSKKKRERGGRRKKGRKERKKKEYSPPLKTGFLPMNLHQPLEKLEDWGATYYRLNAQRGKKKKGKKEKKRGEERDMATRLQRKRNEPPIPKGGRKEGKEKGGWFPFPTTYPRIYLFTFSNAPCETAPILKMSNKGGEKGGGGGGGKKEGFSSRQ